MKAKQKIGSQIKNKNEKMGKILFISSAVTKKLMHLGISGGEVRLAEIMRGFIKDGWGIHFLTNGGGELFCKHFGLNKVINHKFNIKEGTSRFWFVIFTIKILFRFPNNLKNFKGYVYTANELLFDVIPALRLKLTNKNNKWVAVVHWLPPLKFWQRKKSKFFVSLIFMLGERLSVFLIKYFFNVALAVSKSTQRQLLNVGFKNIKRMSKSFTERWNYQDRSPRYKKNLSHLSSVCFSAR